MLISGKKCLKILSAQSSSSVQGLSRDFKKLILFLKSIQNFSRSTLGASGRDKGSLHHPHPSSNNLVPGSLNQAATLTSLP